MALSDKTISLRDVPGPSDLCDIATLLTLRSSQPSNLTIERVEYLRKRINQLATAAHIAFTGTPVPPKGLLEWFVFERDSTKAGIFYYAEIIGPILAATAEEAVQKLVNATGETGVFYVLPAPQRFGTYLEVK